jgi:hypothetical protein
MHDYLAKIDKFRLLCFGIFTLDGLEKLFFAILLVIIDNKSNNNNPSLVQSCIEAR